jgi:hypothetical protein
MKDIASKLTAVQIFGPAVIAADTTPAALDLQGYHAAMIQLSIGVGGITFDGSNKIEFTLQHSDDDSTYTDVAATDLNGKDAPATVTTGIVLSLVAAHASVTTHEIGYIGGKRYLKLKADFSGTHGTGTALSAVLLKAAAELRPVA